MFLNRLSIVITKPILTTTLLALLGSLATASAQSKTITPERVRDNLLNQEPYRFNGVLISEAGRGSAFRAWHPKTIFSAAHMVFATETWTAAPDWYPQTQADDLDRDNKVRTRGYVRWNDYARFATELPGDSEFSKDMIIAFGFRSMGKGAPAKIDTSGSRILTSGGKFIITGYPAKNPYLNEKIKGYYLHSTPPSQADFRTLSGRALIAPLVTTGPGNSGGPVWVRNASKQWVAGGVLTGGLPSETVIYGFTPDIDPLLRAVKPMVSNPPKLTNGVRGVSASSMFFPYYNRRVIPDGVPRWSAFTVGVGAFELEATVETLKLDLDIRTKHRGDLQVTLTSPDGINIIVHNEEGADKLNLIRTEINLSEFFVGALANGPWTLRVQDRLKGDISVLNSFRLEIGVAGAAGSDTGGDTGTTGTTGE